MMKPEFAKVHDHDAVAHKHGLTLHEMANVYSEWATTYEQDLLQDGIYNGPEYAAAKLKELYHDNVETCRVLDVAAGTGLLGEKLLARGFRNIDGLDPARGMLDICLSKNIYKNLICEFLSEEKTDIKSDSYDCLVISGGMGESHIPRSALPEMIRIVKPGGHVCIMMRKEYLETAEEYNNNKLDDAIDQLEKNGYWKKVERTIKPNYSFNKDGVLFVLQVL